MEGTLEAGESKNRVPQDPPPTKTLKTSLKPLKSKCFKIAKNRMRGYMKDEESKIEFPSPKNFLKPRKTQLKPLKSRCSKMAKKYRGRLYGRRGIQI